ncbi:MAG: hypothetical protein HFG71_14870 [Hungatella sp.]|nr:hypothetical protein [Hungatella sp.]
MYAIHGLNYGRGANAKAYEYYSETAAACLDQFSRSSSWTRVKRVAMKVLIFVGRGFQRIRGSKRTRLGKKQGVMEW